VDHCSYRMLAHARTSIKIVGISRMCQSRYLSKLVQWTWADKGSKKYRRFWHDLVWRE
jgi:hypothetical protein